MRKNRNLLKYKIVKKVFIGSFAFFFIKGLIWLLVFFLAGFGLINFN